MMCAAGKQNGFSLLELSIVLVIIGLLAGGVMVGQDLIRQSELRSLLSDIEKFHTAFNSFKNKYNNFPGDINNAVSFWGAASICPGDFTTPSVGTETCNGNRNGRIDTIERYRAWQHMASAGLVEGQYTGVPHNVNPLSISAGNNVPLLQSDAAVNVFFFSDLGTNFIKPGIKHAIFMMNSASPTIGSGQPFFTTEEAFTIDTKIDDGRPGMGILVIPSPGFLAAPDCGNSPIPEISEYNLGLSGKRCVLNYAMGW